MKLKSCKSCGKDIAKNAKACSHCGHKYSRVSGCFAYVLIFFIVIFMIGYVISNLSKNNNNSPSSEVSLTQLAQKQRAAVGQLSSIYRADTDFTNADGSYIILNFQTVKKHSSYKNNRGEVVKNILVIENVTDINVTRNFVTEAAYFVLFDKTGKEIPIIEGIFTQTGKEFSEIMIPLGDSSEFERCKYIMIGGFDKPYKKLLFLIES